MLYLGDFPASATIRLPFSTFAVGTGASITATGFAAADVKIYKDGSTTERSSAAGITATTDFDGVTGAHLISIDTSDNTDAGFFAAGHEYLVLINTITVDGQVIQFWAGAFSIARAGGALEGLATLLSRISGALTISGGAVDANVTKNGGTAITVAAGVQEVKVASYASGQAPLQPTVAGRTLDVSAGGEAGLDWANIGTPTTVVGLSGTTVKTATDVETKATDIQSRLPAALTSGGRMKASVEAILDTAFTEGAAGRIAAAFKQFFNIATPAATMDHGVLVDTVTTVTNAPSDSSGTTTLLSRLSATRAGYLDNLSAGAVALASTFSGITSLAQWLGLIAGKQTGNTTARTEVRATGAGSGTYDETTDSQEALRDRGDSAWTTATGFSTHSAADVWAVGTRTLTSFGTLAADVWASATRLLTAGTNIALAKGTGVTGFNDPSAATIAAAVWDYLTSAATTVGSLGKLLVDNVNATISSRLASGSYSAPPTAAAVADAVWEEALADHSGTAGSTAEALGAAGSAGDPWSTLLPGTYSSGQAGKIIGDNVNATISSRLASGSYTAPDNATISTISTNVSTVLSRLGAFTGTGVNTILGMFKALLNKAASTPSDVGGTFDASTDSTEAIRDRGDAAWTTASPPSAAAIASQVRTELATELARVDVATSTRLASAGYTAPPTAVQNRQEMDANSTKLAGIDAKTTNLPSDPADESLIVAATDAIMARLGAPAGASLSADIAAVLAKWTSAMAESYAAQGDAVTPEQALYMVLQRLTEFEISGTTVTMRKVNGVATAYELTLDDAADPTSSARA